MEELGPNDPPRIGPYRLTHLLGTGGMGKAYLGRTGSGRRIVVKAIRPEHVRNPEFRARFTREVKAARKVGGFYTAQVVEANTEADEPWIASAYIPGLSLGQAVSEHGPLPAPALRVLAAGLAEGLRVIHGHGLSHRDLKPGNILLAEDGPRIIDFGIARPADETRITHTGAVLGTPSYMAPEQTEGVPAEPSADLFSLGTVLYFAATGSNPFTAPNLTATIRRLISPAPSVPHRVPEDIRDLITRCWQQDPGKRPGVDEILELLGELEADENWPPYPVRRATATTSIGPFALDLTAPAPSLPSPEILEIRVEAFKGLANEQRYSEAVPGLEQLLAQVREWYSYDDLIVAEVAAALALCKEKAGDFEAAATFLRLAVPARVAQLESGATAEKLHQLLHTRRLLARYLFRADQVEEAHEAFRALTADQLHYLGPDHPDTLRSRTEAAHCLRELRYWKSAREEYQDLLSDHLRFLGAEHPRTLVIRHNILNCTGHLGRVEDALSGLQELQQTVTRIHDPQAHHVLVLRADIALWRATAGNLERALVEYGAALSDMVEALGLHHPSTRKVQEQLDYFLDILRQGPASGATGDRGRSPGPPPVPLPSTTSGDIASDA